jgi:NAD-dependent deacetylase
MMSDFDSLTSDIKDAQHLVIFTGAGISAGSGIPTYRGENGLWNTYDPNLYANIAYFRQNPSYYWNFFKEVRYPMLKKVRPNKGHVALAELESVVNLKAVITQNIDGLHQDAGSSSVIELHGTTRTIFCMNCSARYTIDEVFPRLETQIPPICDKCSGNLRPAVVFFGEPLNPETLSQAHNEVKACDFLLAAGSSLVVYPAAEIPIRAKQKGARLAIVNKDSTPLDTMADYVITGDAEKVLPNIVQILKKDQ